MTKGKIGLVLQGGGAKGAFQAGALQVLTEQGIRWDFISGTSVGALNGGYLSQFKKKDQARGVRMLSRIWENISNKQIYRKWYRGFLWFLPALWKMSLYTTKPLRKLIEKHFDPQKVRESDVEVVIGAVNLNTGQRREWTNNNIIPETIAASSSFPIAFEPVEIDGDLYTDDGVRETTPLEAAIKAGCTQIYVILTGPAGVVSGSLKKKPRLWHIALRNIAAMMAEIELWDLKVAQLYNKITKNTTLIHGRKLVDIRIIQPSTSLGDSLNFNNIKALINIEKGRLAAEEALMKWGTK